MSLHEDLQSIRASAKKRPAGDAARSALDLVERGSPYAELFFGEIEDPSWLPLLEERGFFSKLPESVVTAEDGVLQRPHLPLLALIRLAPKASEAVTNILAKLRLPENPVVGDQVMRCIASIRDPASVPVLLPIVRQLTENPSRTTWVWIEELLTLWIEHGAVLEAVEVLSGYLLAVVADSSTAPGSSNAWLIQEIDQKIVSRLTPRVPREIATVTFDALSQWAVAERLRERAESLAPPEGLTRGGQDETFPFSFWLEDFKDSPSMYEELAATLATRLYAACQEIFRAGDPEQIYQLDILLRSNTWDLFRRLRWQLYADFPALTLALARLDVLERIPQMHRLGFIHNYEFARLLRTFAEQHGTTFLSTAEVERFCDVVFSGPIDTSGVLIEDDYRGRFQCKQLKPICKLLTGSQQRRYETLPSHDTELDLDSYKPYRSTGDARTIEQIPPAEAEGMGDMPEARLWALINEWKPTKDRSGAEWWIEEDVGALATKFAELVERDPVRFRSETTWWENVWRPAMLQTVLDRASDRIEKLRGGGEGVKPPSQDEFTAWFGIAGRIVSLATSATESGRHKERNTLDEDLDWGWARIVVAKFIKTVVRASIPLSHETEVRSILTALVEQKDLRLDSDNQKMGDWLTTAINSARGGAVDALLQLALRQKQEKQQIENWIFDLISSRLSTENESPAFFALLGSRLRLFVHLFQDRLINNSTLLFPADRVSHLNAIIASHFQYDRPATAIIQTFPSLIEIAIELVPEMAIGTGNSPHRAGRDFGSQVGTHVAFYYWNGLFSSEGVGERSLDRFFAVAPKDVRANLIGRIGSIFQKITNDPTNQVLIPRVMRLWDRRYAQLCQILDVTNQISEYEGELSKFTDWLRCECFPFDWRFTNVSKAIDRLTRSPRSFELVKALSLFAERPERVAPALQLLVSLLSKPQNDFGWSIRQKEIGPLLARGLASQDVAVKDLAELARDLLLKQGRFEFLEVGGT
jgi:hypothetical protein